MHANICNFVKPVFFNVNNFISVTKCRNSAYGGHVTNSTLYIAQNLMILDNAEIGYCDISFIPNGLEMIITVSSFVYEWL